MSDPDAPEEAQGLIQDMDAAAASEAESAASIHSSIQFFRKGPDNNLLAAVVEPSQDFPAGIAISVIQGWIHKQD